MTSPPPSPTPDHHGSLSRARVHAPQRPVNVVNRLYRGREVFFHCVRTVADVMTHEVACLYPDHTIGDAVSLMREYACHHVPILVPGDDPDAPERLVGLVSQRDVARVVGAGGDLDGHAEDVMAEPLSSICTRDPVTITPQTALPLALRVLVERKFDCLPVVAPQDPGALVGILTDNDIVNCFLRMEALRKAQLTGAGPVPQLTQSVERLIDALMGRVEDVMSTALFTVAPDTPVGEVIGAIQERRIRHVPVVDARGQVLGVVTDRDALAALPRPPRFLGPRRPEGFRAHLFRHDPSDEATRRALAQPAIHVMSPCPVAVAPRTPLVRLAELFSGNWRGFFPVVDDDRRLLGLVTQTDFLTGIVSLSRIIARQRRGQDRGPITPRRRGSEERQH